MHKILDFYKDFFFFGKVCYFSNLLGLLNDIFLGNL